MHLLIYVYKYICTYICMRVCMYVCMYVCVYVQCNVGADTYIPNSCTQCTVSADTVTFLTTVHSVLLVLTVLHS